MKWQWSHDNKTVKIVRWEGTPFLWYEYIQIHTVISQLTLEILEKIFQLPSNSFLKNTVERWFNEPLCVISFNPAKIAIKCIEQNLDITNELRFNEILVITNTTQKRKHKIYLEITNKCHYVTER